MNFRETYNAPLCDGTPRRENGFRIFVDVKRCTLRSPLLKRASDAEMWRGFLSEWLADGRDTQAFYPAWAQFSTRWLGYP